MTIWNVDPLPPPELVEDLDDVSIAGRGDGDALTWNEQEQLYEHRRGGGIVLSSIEPTDATQGTVWGDLQATFFVNPDGTRDTDV